MRPLRTCLSRGCLGIFGLLFVLVVACESPGTVPAYMMAKSPGGPLFAEPRYLAFVDDVQTTTAVLTRLDHDPWKDLLIFDKQVKALQAHDGQGGGNLFGRPRTMLANFLSYWMLAVDFSGDGDTDLIIQAADERSIYLLQGDGQGAFLSQKLLPLDEPPEKTVDADVDGDGRQDLLLSFYAKRKLGVLRNTGGSFAPISYYPAALPPDQIAVSDLNGDGAPDVVLGEYDYKTGQSAFEILLNDGRGSFNQLISYPLEAPIGGLTVADVNGDCTPDVVLSQVDKYLANLIFIYQGQGDGRLREPLLLVTAGRYAEPILVDEFNGDGVADIAIATVDSIALLKGRDGGSFEPAEQYLAVPDGANAGTSMFISDQNLDGKPDIVLLTALHTPQNKWKYGVMTLLNQGLRRSSGLPACAPRRQ